MELLQIKNSPKFQKVTDEIFRRQFEEDPNIGRELSESAKKKMYQDVCYNMNILYIALELDDGKIFECYARWLYQLLCPIMSYCTRERIKDQMLDHYNLVKKCLGPVIEEEKRQKLEKMLDRAIEVTVEECAGNEGDKPWEPGRFGNEAKQYLDCLMKSDTKGAVYLISEYIKRGIPLEDVFVDIIAKTMEEVGELWHKNIVSVDMEHYCTSTTQLAMSQLYPVIFRQKRKGKTVLAACVGSELHEMGSRMVADLFEYNGWDSIYLGAAATVEEILAAIDEHHPLLAALSVTMPQHLPECKAAVMQIRAIYPDIKIAVGGKAFSSTNEIWKNWRVDVYTQDARELVAWAEHTLR